MADNGFIDCRHAGPLLDPHLRACRSPKLIGLKQVTPELCAGCVYRDHPDDGATPTPRRLTDCLYLGEPLDVEDSNGNGRAPGATHHCQHGDHERTTRQQCQFCSDYQFPVLSPRMSLAEVRRIRGLASPEQPEGWWLWPNVQAVERQFADDFIDGIPPYPGGFNGRGIVVVGGGKYFPSAWVTIRVLRHVNCALPVQLWHLDGEVPPGQRRLLARYDVECVDADALRDRHPYRFMDGHWWKGWQLKPYAVRHCPFEEVLLLDADCYPVRDPEPVFEWTGYREHGAVFWPDIESSLILLKDEDVKIFGVPACDERPTESGQLLVNKRQCWRELNLALHYNARADFTYNILWGDKDTYPIAWRRLGTTYARMHPDSRGTPHGILHFDQHGDLLFQHRCTAKFTLDETRFDSTPGQLGYPAQSEFLLEGFCHSALDELRRMEGTPSQS